ncbi:c-type cytochrome [Flavobacterium humi]|uniref:C-type cytochrome n=1 Tax=Flavobacterium humi TaxID=2562683 RepID=A0A4Z0LAX1_9FLAO|nr:c-type cytochrome [Flavobacterium humi]TGD58707.1 c-type cytochrome [Flavobacterium humi]
MKNTVRFFSLLAVVCCTFSGLVSCKSEEQKTEPLYPDTETAQTPQQLGQEIFDGKGVCYSCHKPETKTIGPSLKDIAKIYKAKGGNIVEFLKGNAEPLVDPSQYEVMKTNFAITKNLSAEEQKALEAYIFSHL